MDDKATQKSIIDLAYEALHNIYKSFKLLSKNLKKPNEDKQIEIYQHIKSIREDINKIDNAAENIEDQTLDGKLVE